jgi:hypothetical protein
LFGREPDHRPIEGGGEWQLADTCAVMVYADAEAAGGGHLIVGVSDLDAHAAELYEHEIVLEPYSVPSGRFRLAELSDPWGNAVTFAETL